MAKSGTIALIAGLGVLVVGGGVVAAIAATSSPPPPPPQPAPQPAYQPPPRRSHPMPAMQPQQQQAPAASSTSSGGDLTGLVNALGGLLGNGQTQGQVIDSAGTTILPDGSYKNADGSIVSAADAAAQKGISHFNR